MKSPSLITIVICTRNRAAVLERVLAHHHHYKLPNDWEREYVIVNNGSTDRTNDVVEDFGRKATFPVRLIVESRPGHSIALNTGCKAAKGEIIAFTDDDAIPADQWLVEIIRSISDLGNDWVYGPVRPIWDFGKKPLWYGPKTSFWVACLDYGNQPFLATDPSTTFAGVNHACKATRLFELGLYDEKKGLRADGKTYTGNDDDLYSKALSNGWKVYYNPKVAVDHIIDPKRSRVSLHLRNAWLVGRNEYYNLARNHVETNQKGKAKVPRYRYRLVASHFLKLLLSAMTCTPPGFTYYLSQIYRFLGLLYTSFRAS
jgi:glycosyltransferase involved in cell wall biosynthesis